MQCSLFKYYKSECIILCTVDSTQHMVNIAGSLGTYRLQGAMAKNNWDIRLTLSSFSGFLTRSTPWMLLLFLSEKCATLFWVKI